MEWHIKVGKTNQLSPSGVGFKGNLSPEMVNFSPDGMLKKGAKIGLKNFYKLFQNSKYNNKNATLQNKMFLF